MTTNSAIAETNSLNKPRFAELEFSEKAYIILVCLLWGRASSGCFYAVFFRVPLISEIADYIYPFLLIVSAISSINYLARRLKFRDVAFFFVVALFYGISIMAHPISSESAKFLEENASNFYFWVIPYFFIGLTIDIDKVKTPFFYISIFTLLFQFWYFINIGTSKWSYTDGQDDFMSFSYSILPSACYIIWQSFDNKFSKYITIPLAILGTFFIFSLGNRGSLVSLFICVLFIIALKVEKKTFFRFAVAILLAIFLYIRFYDSIMTFLTSAIGISQGNSRILNYIIAEDFFHSNGREELNAVIKDALLEEPLFGYGLAGDRNFLDIYSHNIFLEFIMSFGWLVGLLLCIYLCWLIFKAFRNSRGNERFYLAVLLWGGTGQLLVSSTFLCSFWFFMLLGYCIKINRKI